ncbi:type I glyceraldehyde-3-phosphate dehydrogenase, partial [bacterium]|nr:type I glyceraldehyde-3-phosphate dehydrogenase [bacterium]
MTKKIGINGFGRIGRNFLRVATEYPDLSIVAVNDITDPGTLAHLFKYDSVHGTFKGEVSVEGSNLVINGKKIEVFAEQDPSNLPWKAKGVELVIESTGIFLSKELASKHLIAGARKVILSAPAKGSDIPTFVIGVNEKDYDSSKYDIISNASCTTNCLAPLVKVLDDNFKVVCGFMTTIHS